jgi:type IV secretion system protein VirB6
VLFLLSALAGIASVRIVAALMLALGPYFVAFLLFENTRSLLEGWIRVIAGATIGAIGVAVALAFELSVLEPWLSTVLARRNSHEALPAAPTELLVITALFVLVIVAMLLASARLSAAFRLASWRGALSSRAKDPAVAATGSAMVRDRELTEMRSRATATANAIASLHQREAIGRELASRNRARFELRPAGTSEQRPAVGLHNLPTGRAFPRRGRGRASASARRRDGNP